MLHSFVLLFCVLVVIGSGEYLQSNYKYYKSIDGWLKLHRVPSTWDGARRACFNEDGVLASPTTEAMHSALKEYFLGSNWTMPCGIYLGMHSTLTPRIYYSIEGIPLTSTNLVWTSDTPKRKAEAKCGAKFQLSLAMYHDGTITDQDRNHYLPFVCYRKNDKKNRDTCSCGSSDPGYTMNTQTASCYKFHTKANQWNRAAETCALEGGYLVSIGSQQEADELKKLFANYPAEVIDSKYKDTAMVGIADWDQQGDWANVYGLALADSGFSSWAPGQPNNEKTASGRTGQFCAAITREALLDDVWCAAEKYPFICEKSIECLPE